MQIEYLISPNEEVLFFRDCSDHNTPVLVKGLVYRVEVTITPTPGTTGVDTVKTKYIMRTNRSQNVTLEDPIVFDSATLPPVRSDMFKLADRAEALAELDLRLAEVSI